MAEIIVVTSGKGGVGKTTSSASIACGLAKAGKKTVVIDFDVGLRNLDLIMGCERRVVYDFVNVVHGEASLKQALIKDKRFDNLYVLAASQTRDKDALSVLNKLKPDDRNLVIKQVRAGDFDFKEFKKNERKILKELRLRDPKPSDKKENPTSSTPAKTPAKRRGQDDPISCC